MPVGAIIGFGAHSNLREECVQCKILSLIRKSSQKFIAHLCYWALAQIFLGLLVPGEIHSRMQMFSAT
jgi:hypothetical protein